MSKPIFLIGYMGCGKSSVGKKLAKRLKLDFIDIDLSIEQMTGKSIARIFDQEGEDQFRQLERSILVSLCSRSNIVVATGGGAPCFFDNMMLMNKSGTTVYIKMHPASLTDRILSSDIERPLVRKFGKEDMPVYIAQHLKEREVFYNTAKITIKGENLNIEELEHLIRNRR